MKFRVLILAFLLFPCVALADGYRLATQKFPGEFQTLTAAGIAAGDYYPVWDASANDWKRVDATTTVGSAFNGTVGATTPSTGVFTSVGATLAVTDTRAPTADSATTNNGFNSIFTVPADTTGTNTHNAFNVTPTISNATGGTNKFNGFNFANVTGDAQVDVTAFRIGTGTTLGTSNGIVIGSGWDLGISDASGISTSGTLTTTGAISVDGVTLNNKSLSLPGRAVISICGDLTTINNNTVYYGPSAVLLTQSGQTCDTTAAGNTTEATADEPGFVGTAFQVLSMDCRSIAPGATVSFTLRSAAAATTPSITCSETTAQTDCETNTGTTTAIASGATIAIAAASTGDIGSTKGFRCNLQVAY